MKNITFINAGAGSGKTYSLTETLYKNINEKYCQADQVILTTFTKKAAEEIKQRAHSKLVKERKLNEAILLQNALMGTVHSVGYQLIKKYCYLLGLSPNIKELSTEDTDFYFSQAISNIPSSDELRRISELTKIFDFQKTEKNNTTLDENRWRNDVLDIIGKARPNSITDLSLTSISYKKSEEFIRKVFKTRDSGEALSIVALLPHVKALVLFIENLPDTKNKTIKETATNIAKLINSTVIPLSQYFKIHQLAADVLKKDPSHSAANAILTSIGDFYQLPEFLKILLEYNQLIFGISNRCIDEYSKYKKSAGLVDFTDMETLFLELLSIPEVVDDLKRQIKVVMVDEFQDSNPIQLAIFLKLSEIAQKSIWVGDPKQAIYGFNGSDPLLVSMLLQKFYEQNQQGLEIQILKNSYRSRPDLVQFSNRIFETALLDQSTPIQIERKNVIGGENIPEWMNQKFGTAAKTTLQATDVIGLLATRNDVKEGFSNSSNAIKHWHFSNTYKGGGNDDQLYHYLAQRIKEVIDNPPLIFDKHTNQLRHLQPCDIGILCRTKNECQVLAKKLSNQGVQASTATTGLALTAEFRLMSNILNYIADPQNDLAITELMLLTTSDELLTPEKLLELRLEFVAAAPPRTDENSNAYYEYLAKWGEDNPFIIQLENFAQNNHHLSVPELIEKLMVQLQLNKYAAAWGNAEQRNANLHLMINYARAYDDYCLKLNSASSLVGFTKWLNDNSDRDLQAPTTNRNAVNIMTYHKAKGLEFPFLILSSLKNDHTSKVLQKDFFKTTVKSEGDFNVERPLEGRYINFSFWPFGTSQTINGYEKTIKESDLFIEMDRVRLQELKRLLYVGMTRARDYLVTYTFNAKKPHWLNLVNEKNSTWNDNLFSTISSSGKLDLYGLGVEVEVEYIADSRDEFSEELVEMETQSDTYFPLDGIRNNASPKYLLATRFFGNTHEVVEIIEDFKHRISIRGNVDEAEMGNCLHDILFLMNRNLDQIKIESILSNFNLAGLLPSADVMQAVANLKAYIDALKPINVYREIPLTLAEYGYVYTGVADLVVELTDGFYIIDYKSFPGKIIDILNPESNHFAGLYSGQLNAYKRMIEANTNKKVLKELIYYTVLGKLVEI